VLGGRAAGLCGSGDVHVAERVADRRGGASEAASGTCVENCNAALRWLRPLLPAFAPEGLRSWRRSWEARATRHCGRRRRRARWGRCCRVVRRWRQRRRSNRWTRVRRVRARRRTKEGMERCKSLTTLVRNVVVCQHNPIYGRGARRRGEHRLPCLVYSLGLLGLAVALAWELLPVGVKGRANAGAGGRGERGRDGGDGGGVFAALRGGGGSAGRGTSQREHYTTQSTEDAGL
jgi:hypothetical protein